jgi:hypothetical protein
MESASSIQHDSEPCIFHFGFVYSRPIRIPVNSCAIGATAASDRHLVAFTSTILFNLGLAHLLQQGLGSTGIPVNMAYKKALAIYRHVIRLQNLNVCGCTFFVMSSINNIGVLHWRLGNTAAANRCFRRLLTVLMTIIFTGGEEATVYEGFFQNIARMCNPTWSICAGSA